MPQDRIHRLAPSKRGLKRADRLDKKPQVERLIGACGVGREGDNRRFAGTERPEATKHGTELLHAPTLPKRLLACTSDDAAAIMVCSR
jgi:hypothetical protein